MSAKLIIAEGESAGKEIPIQFSVLRIGSGASCDLQVRGIADVAATLRYDQGRYQVLNRGTNPIDLGGEVIDPQKSKIWPNQGLLRLSEQCVLKLEIDGDPAPRSLGSISKETIDQLAAAAQTEPDPESEDEDATIEKPARAKMDPQKAMQMTVIALCIVAGIGIQLRDYAKSSGLLAASPTAAVDNQVLSEKFRYPVTELLDKEKSLLESNAEDVYFQYVQLRESLQEARIADIREDWNVAAFYYREVLEQMRNLNLEPTTVSPSDSSKDPKTKTPSLKMSNDEYQKLPLELQLDVFVRQRLAQIDPKVSKFTSPDA